MLTPNSKFPEFVPRLHSIHQCFFRLMCMSVKVSANVRLKNSFCRVKNVLYQIQI